LEKSGNILWCRPSEAPFSELPIAPVDYSQKQMMGTIYEADYLHEHLQNTVDNLNLLYVAFTRASKNLFVIGRRKATATRSALIESVLPLLKLDGCTLEGMTAADGQEDAADTDDDETRAIRFDYGSLCIPDSNRKDRQASKNVFLQPVTPVSAGVETFRQQTTFRQSNRSRDFIEGDDQQEETGFIKMGSVLHEIFSTIRTTADIDQALQQLQQEGILYDDEITREKLAAMLRKRLEQSRVAQWFDARWRVFNECTILRLDSEGRTVERRPDRVITDGNETHVVDFKFGKQQPEHQEQVSEYVRLLRQMGMPGVRGWLWYVYTNRIVECGERGEMRGER